MLETFVKAREALTTFQSLNIKSLATNLLLAICEVFDSSEASTKVGSDCISSQAAGELVGVD